MGTTWDPATKCRYRPDGSSCWCDTSFMCAARVTATGTALTAGESEVLDLVRQRLTSPENRVGVLRQYAQLSRVLNDELGVEPGPEATPLHDLAKIAPTLDSGRLPLRFDVASCRATGHTRCCGFHRLTDRRSSVPH